MTLLLDTHVCLWVLSDPGRLAANISEAIVAPDNDVRVSIVSAWEIAIKQSLGKLELPAAAEEWLPVALEKTGLDWISVTPAEALRVRSLPWHHRDPFDRLLIAQAMTGYTLVTHDNRLRQYNVPILTV